LYVRNYKNQQYLESSLIHDIHEILDSHSKLPYRDMLIIWKRYMHKTLDEHLEEYPIEDKANDKKTFVEKICKGVKKFNVPIMYSVNNIKKFETTMDQKLYNDYADMVNNNNNSVLIKDFLDNSIRDLLNEHVAKYGYNTEGTNEYLILKQEV
jgi:hypothetical protein